MCVCVCVCNEENVCVLESMNESPVEMFSPIS